jgi:hypothetical protein
MGREEWARLFHRRGRQQQRVSPLQRCRPMHSGASSGTEGRKSVVVRPRSLARSQRACDPCCDLLQHAVGCPRRSPAVTRACSALCARCRTCRCAVLSVCCVVVGGSPTNGPAHDDFWRSESRAGRAEAAVRLPVTQWGWPGAPVVGRAPGGCAASLSLRCYPLWCGPALPRSSSSFHRSRSQSRPRSAQQSTRELEIAIEGECVQPDDGQTDACATQCSQCNCTHATHCGECSRRSLKLSPPGPLEVQLEIACSKRLFCSVCEASEHSSGLKVDVE